MAFIVTVTALKCLYIIPVMFFTVEMSEDILSRLLTVAKHFSLVAVGLFSTYKSCFKKTTISCEFFKKKDKCHHIPCSVCLISLALSKTFLLLFFLLNDLL